MVLRELCAPYPQAFPHGLGATRRLRGTFCSAEVLWKSFSDGATLSTMPLAAVCPRFLHRVIHRYPALVDRSSCWQKHSLNQPQSVHDQKTYNLLKTLKTKGYSEVPPCFPQAAPHNPWKVLYLWKQGLARGLWSASRKICDKLSTCCWEAASLASQLPQKQVHAVRVGAGLPAKGPRSGPGNNQCPPR
ncbi:hypothetical protein PssiTeo3_19180 [Pseudomonas sichuanensis]|nr:hypothetical protein [Pseudomonas sichuanensis]